MQNYFKYAESKKEMEGYINAMRTVILGERASYIYFTLCFNWQGYYNFTD